MEQFSRGYERFGLTKQQDGLTYREWAPGAKVVHLIGDFSKYPHYNHYHHDYHAELTSVFCFIKTIGTEALMHVL